MPHRGLIGPGRLFSIGTMYHPQTFAALAGAIAPIPIWLCMRKWPRSIMRNVSIPVGLNGVLYMPPATGINYASWILVGAVFQFWIRRRRFAWWSKVSSDLGAEARRRDQTDGHVGRARAIVRRDSQADQP